MSAVGPGLRPASEAISPSAYSLQTSPAKNTSDVVIVPDPESIALGAEELEGEKHVLGRLGGGGDKPTGNANGRPAKTAIGAAIERTESARVAHEAALHRERMKHHREMSCPPIRAASGPRPMMMRQQEFIQ